MRKAAEDILQYLRDEFEADYECSRKDLDDICGTLQIFEHEAREALAELQASGKVYCFQDCNEPHDEEWQACGANITWDEG